MNLLDRISSTPQWRNFPFSMDAVIHIFEGGSALHGARVAGKSDLDVYGIFIEPPEAALGIDKFEHYVTSTSDDSERNSADDLDITMYSLRRWAALAAKGNPTALNFLFAENARGLGYGKTLWHWHHEELRKAMICKRSALQFKGFVSNQMGRLLGTKGAGKHGQRPELIENHGYDTKAGMHAVRLMGEVMELMRTGRITFPNPAKEALINIRNGGWSLDFLNNVVSKMLHELDEVIEKSDLPEKADRGKINHILAGMHHEQWKSWY